MQRQVLIQSQSTQSREEEIYKIVSKGLQKNELVYLETRGHGLGGFFLVSHQEVVSVKPGVCRDEPGHWHHSPGCPQRMAAQSWPRSLHSTQRSHTSKSHPQTQQYLYLAGLPTLLLHQDFVEAVSSV